MKKDNSATCLGWVAYILILLVVSSFLNGLAMSIVWNWFMPPIFGLVSLTLWQAVGVSLVFELFTGTNRTKKSETFDKDDSETEIFVKGILQALLTPTLTVLIAWVVFQLAF